MDLAFLARLIIPSVRHNGVVIGSTDGVDRRRSTGDGDPHSPGSRSKSRSRTPSSKDNPAAPTSLPPTTVPPGGPQSYYRQHTFAGGEYIHFWRDSLILAIVVMMPPPGMIVDGHYSPAVGLPTSAARLHQASWQSAPPWGGDGSQPPPPHMIHPGYAQPYYNPPPQYYRPGNMMHLPDVVTHQQIPNGISSSSNGESSSSRNGSPVIAVDPSLDRAGMEDLPETGDAETAMIDPSLVSPSASSADSESPFTRHSNVPNAMFNAIDGESSTDGQVPRMPQAGSSPSFGKHDSLPSSGEPPNEEGNGSDSETTTVRNLLSPGRDHPYTSPHSAPLERPLEMEQILTEDGEPMLNPGQFFLAFFLSPC